MKGKERISILQADLGDLESLVPLFDDYRRFYHQRSSPMAARRFLRDRLKRKESVIFLARAGRAPIGFVQLYPTFSSVALKRLWILNDLFVAPAGRRRHVASALMVRAQKLAKATKAEGLCLETALDNRAAQRLYEGLGWKREKKFFRYNYDF